MPTGAGGIGKGGGFETDEAGEECQRTTSRTSITIHIRGRGRGASGLVGWLLEWLFELPFMAA